MQLLEDEAEALLDHVPGQQGKHDSCDEELIVVEYVPPPHPMQTAELVTPAEIENVPASHNMQTSDEEAPDADAHEPDGH